MSLPLTSHSVIGETATISKLRAKLSANPLSKPYSFVNLSLCVKFSPSFYFFLFLIRCSVFIVSDIA